MAKDNKSKDKGNIQALKNETVEFVSSNNATQPESVIVPASTSDGLPRPNNAPMFSSASDAIAKIKQWSDNDKDALKTVRAMAKHCLTEFACNMDLPDEARNAQPLTYLKKNLDHRGKGGLGAKLVACVQGVTNYKWNANNGSFRLKKGKRVEALSPAAIEAFDKGFDLWQAPKKAAPAFDGAMKLNNFVKACQNNGMTPDEIATLLTSFSDGRAHEIITVRMVGAAKPVAPIAPTSEAQRETNAANNSAEAA